MAKAKEILNRRKSVQNTKKITRTMEMVSTARFKKASDRIKAARPYGERLLTLVREVAVVGWYHRGVSPAKAMTEHLQLLHV